MGVLHERNCGNCTDLKFAVSSGYCDTMEKTFTKTGDTDFAGDCPHYTNKYGYHESGILYADISEFFRICKRLDKLMKRIRKYRPEANYYLANESLHLMSGESHDMNGHPHQENSVDCVLIEGMGGGDW